MTPKAFLPLADGQRLFGSRFGQTTGLRISTETAETIDELRQRLTKTLTPTMGELGWSIRPIRQQQLSASRGTTPFDGLFLSLSFFVILAAVMLIAMLFRLGLVQRMKQFGTLLAVGWSPRQVAKLALGEGLLVAAVGVAIGVVGGILYASGVLWALRSWWVGAVTVPFLTFHWTLSKSADWCDCRLVGRRVDAGDHGPLAAEGRCPVTAFADATSTPRPNERAERASCR